MQLSPRQKQILRLMADGKNNKEIAKEMGVATGTITSQKWTARIKVGVRDELALYIWATKNPKELK
jgi:two-component system nitrate/nitrite response regulator NarL